MDWIDCDSLVDMRGLLQSEEYRWREVLERVEEEIRAREVEEGNRENEVEEEKGDEGE